MQSCHNWQRIQSWQRGRNASSLQVEDLRPKKNGGNPLRKTKEGKCSTKCSTMQFNVVQKRANKKLLLYLYLFFHLLSRQSDALNSLIPNVFANSKAFSLSMIPSIGLFGFFFQQTSGKLLYLFGCSSHSVCFFVKKTFLSFPKKLSVSTYFSPM